MSDVFEVSGRALLLQLLSNGRLDEKTIHSLVKGRIRDKFPQLLDALHCKLSNHQRFLLQQSWDHLGFDYGNNAYTIDDSSHMVPLSDFDITSYFNRAGKVLGEGLHMEYWIRHSTRDAIDVKIEIIVLANDTEAIENLNAFCRHTVL